MAESSQEVLNELLRSLRANNSRSLADEIARVVARGVTEETEVNGRVKELAQRPLTSDEAYRISLEMFIASLEPIIMKRHALHEIEEVMGVKSSIVWAQDVVEKSPISLDDYEEVVVPDALELVALEDDLKALVDLLDSK